MLSVKRTKQYVLHFTHHHYNNINFMDLCTLGENGSFVHGIVYEISKLPIANIQLGIKNLYPFFYLDT